MFGRKVRGAGAAHYLMRQRMFSIGDDYWIEDEQGEHVYKIDGKAMRLRKTLIFEDADGHEILKIQERRMRLRDTMDIEDTEGRTVATVKKAMINPIREHWHVNLDNGSELKVKGNIVDHEYRIENGHTMASVSKKWFRVRDSYGVEVAAEADPVLMLAIAAVLDTMAHPAR